MIYISFGPSAIDCIETHVVFVFTVAESISLRIRLCFSSVFVRRRSLLKENKQTDARLFKGAVWTFVDVFHKRPWFVVDSKIAMLGEFDFLIVGYF